MRLFYINKLSLLAMASRICKPIAFPMGGGTAFPICRCFSRVVPWNL